VEVVRANFGSGPDDLGNYVPEEASPEGPMSFALGSNDEIYILDQLNSRIQVFRSKTRIKTIPIPDNSDSAFIDIALTKDGKIVLLDGEMKKKVFLLDAEGTALKDLPLAGKYIPDDGKGQLPVYGVFCREDGIWDGIWVDIGNRSVRIADLTGTPDPNRESVMGTFTYDGKRLMKVESIGEATAVVHLSKENNPAQWNDFFVHFDMSIDGLDGPYDDKAGNIYLGASLEHEGTFANVMVILDPAGKEKKRIHMFVPYRAEQIWRELRVSPDGRIFQLALDEQGAAVRRYNP
jgi:hypothetical protein